MLALPLGDISLNACAWLKGIRISNFPGNTPICSPNPGRAAGLPSSNRVAALWPLVFPNTKLQCFTDLAGERWYLVVVLLCFFVFIFHRLIGIWVLSLGKVQWRLPPAGLPPFLGDLQATFSAPCLLCPVFGFFHIWRLADRRGFSSRGDPVPRGGK